MCDPYGTHQLPLLISVLRTKGNVLEMGSGHYSTPLIHTLLRDTKRLLLTTDISSKWLEQFKYLENSFHSFIKVDDWDMIGGGGNWSVVFIDHSPGERRCYDIIRLRANTEVFVIHDTEAKCYGYDRVINTFKYSYTHKIYPVWTTIVSDKINVAEWFN